MTRFKGFGLEGRAAGQQMIENRAQRIDVAAPAHFAALSTGLLGRHEVGRAEHLAGHGDAGIAVEPLGQAKIGDARLIGGRVNQHVRRLEIAMQDASLVRVMNRFGNELDVPRGFRAAQWTVAHELREVLALDVIHREVMLAVVDADVVNGDDVRMLEQRGSRDLAPEPLNDPARWRTARPESFSPRRCGPD